MFKNRNHVLCNARKTFFALSVIICAFGWLSAAFWVFHLRAGVMPELDDAYSYLVKASEMQEDFYQDSPALNDIKQQVFVPPESKEFDFLRSRISHRLFSVYHPLHSAILVVLHSLGLTWEASYWALFFAGKLFLVCGIAYWLYPLFGAVNAGGVLLLLTFGSFSGHGLLFVVPSNLSLGIAMFLWGEIAKKTGMGKKRCLALVFLMEAMHPIGRLYAAAGLLAIFLSFDKRDLYIQRYFILFYGALILLPFVLPMVVETPFLEVVTESPSVGWTVWEGLKNEIASASQILKHWLGSGISGSLTDFIKTLFISFAVIYGSYVLPNENKKSALSIFLALLCILSLQFVRIHPSYPGVLFERTVIPFAIICYAFFISGLIKIFKNIFVSVESSKKLTKININYFTLFIIFILMITYHEQRKVLQLIGSVNTMVSRQNIQPDIGQIDQIKKLLIDKPHIKIIYQGEIPLYIYLTHGFWEYGAIMSNIVFGSTIENELFPIDKDNLPSFFIGRSPLFRLKKLGYLKGVRLKNGEYIDIHKESKSFDFNGYIVEYKESTDGLSIHRIDLDNHLISDGIRLDQEGVIHLSKNAVESTKGLRISNIKKSTKFINGFRTVKQAEIGLHWPWDSGLIFQSCYSRPGGSDYSTVFSSPYLIQYGLGVTALDDSGATNVFTISELNKK